MMSSHSRRHIEELRGRLFFGDIRSEWSGSGYRQIVTMSLTTLTAVATLAVCIIGASGSVPEYAKARVNLQYGERLLFQLLPDPNNVTVNEKKLGYLLLVEVLAEVGNEIATGCLLPDYTNKTYYDAVDKAQKRVSLEPKKVLEEVTDEVNLANNKTALAQELVIKYCGLQGRRALLPPCNILIDTDVQKDLNKYGEPARALLVLGDLGKLWADSIHEVENLKKMSDFLLTTGLEELRPLIKKVAQGKKHLRDHNILPTC